MPSVGVPLPPPFKGQNDQVPTFALESPYCKKMYNFNTENGVVNLRNGHKKFAQTTANSPVALALAPYDAKLFMVVDDTAAGLRWYDISTGTPVSAHTTGPAGGDTQVVTLYFNKYLYFFGEGSLVSNGPVFYNGSAWGKATWTFPGGGTPYSGAVYKNRAYIIDRLKPDFWYTEIDGIGGATTRVSLESIISQKGYLVAIKSVSLSQNVTQENLIAFIFNTGEILVYSGSYPNSESWGIVARLKTSPLVWFDTTIDAKGDTFLLTTSEILSLRNLIARGYDVEQKEGIGAAIDNRYREIIKLLNAFYGPALGFVPYVKGVYDARNDRLIVQFPQRVPGSSGGSYYPSHHLIYDFTLQSWYEYFHTGTAPIVEESRDICAWKSDIYFLTYDDGIPPATVYATAYQLEGSTGFTDDKITTGTTGIEYTLLSAPHPLNRYGVVKTDGLEVIMKSNIYASANWRLIGDLGAQQTAQQKTTGNGTNITKTFVNLGIESNLVQYELTGTSTTSNVGLEIYGTNLWINPSQGVAR